MNLGQVYSNQVHSRPVSFGMASFTNIERDQIFTNLENNVFSKLNEIVVEDSKNFEKEEEKVMNFGNNSITSYGLEDAIRELINFKNKGSISSK